MCDACGACPAAVTEFFFIQLGSRLYAAASALLPFRYRQLWADVTHDVFLDFHLAVEKGEIRCLENYCLWTLEEMEAPCWVYLVRVLSRQCRHVEKHPIYRWTSDSEFDQETDLVDNRFNPQRQFEKNEFVHTIQRSLLQLPRDYREVVVLHDMSGMPYQQIANVLDIPIGTVRSRLYRARQELRILLREFSDEKNGDVLVGQTDGQQW